MKAVLVFAALMALVAMPTDASHFRYGTLRWHLTTVQPKAEKDRVSIVLEMAMRYGWAKDLDYHLKVHQLIDFDYIMKLGDGVKAHMHSFEITVSDPVEDIIMGIWEGYHYYEKGKTYEVKYKDCCRLAGIGNNSEGDWQLITHVRADAAGHQSVTSSYVPIVEVGDSGVQQFQLIGVSPDHGAMHFEFADETRMGGVMPTLDTSVLSIDVDTGMITWDVTGWEHNYYNLQVVINGVSSSDVQVPVDFFVKISKDRKLCVDDCDNSGDICGSARAYYSTCTGCSGSGGEGDVCKKNLNPTVITPEYIEVMFGHEVIVEPTFGHNVDYEAYQDLHISTGSLPRGSTWVWTEAPRDTGHGILTIPAGYEEIQYAICFVAHDGYRHGIPACTQINIKRPAPPNVIAPAEVHGWVEEGTEFAAHFDDDYEGDYHHMVWKRSGDVPECVSFDTEEHDGTHGYKGMIKISLECAADPMDFTICFESDDPHRGEHDYGTTTCTHVVIAERPPIDCFATFTTRAECHAEELCYWDDDGKDSYMDDSPVGCYPFHMCKQMDDFKASCKTHDLCHYGHFGECMSIHNEAKPWSEENWEGDPCRAYSKKACRETDGYVRKQLDFHCEWEPINEWCVSPEIHLPHADLCRSQTDRKMCDWAVRNGRQCNWVEHETGTGNGEGKCYGEWVPGQDKTQRMVYSNKKFAAHKITKEDGWDNDDFEHGTFLHWQHHFATESDDYYTHDNLHQPDYDYDYLDTHDYAHIHQTV